MLSINSPHSEKVSEIKIKTGNESGKMIWTGRIMSGISVLFMLFDSITKIIKAPQSIEGTVSLGYPATLVPVIGLILFILTIIYIIPRTSFLGAVLLTGYLGGAVASNFRLMNPLFSHTLFPVYMAVLIWGGLYLRDNFIKQLIMFRKKTL